jgi:hypothetical protein
MVGSDYRSLQIQKSGLTYATSRKEWRLKFDIEIKEDARPLLILVPFGPVSLVYDVLDANTDKLPTDIFSFPSSGSMSEVVMGAFESLILKKGVQTIWIDKGDCNAGSIELVQRATTDKYYSTYKVKINKNHIPTTRFATTFTCIEAVRLPE